MPDNRTTVAIQLSRNVLVASIQVDLEEDVLARFQNELLQRVQDTGTQGVILELSGLVTLDSREFDGLRRIITACEIMGARTVLAGLQPGVVSALIETGAQVDGLRAAIDLDAAFALLNPPEPETETEETAEATADSVPEECPEAGATVAESL